MVICRPGNARSDAARLAQPLLGRDDGAHALARAVVLPDRARREHLHDPTLHRGRARRGGVQDPLHAGEVVVLPGRFEDADEVGRHHVRRGDALTLDELEARLGGEAGHHDDRAAFAQAHLGVGARRGVVRRTAQQVDVEGLEAPERGERVGRVLGGGEGRSTLDALRPAGRARRVVHGDDGRAEVVVGRWRRRTGPQGLVVGMPRSEQAGELGERRPDDRGVVVHERGRSGVGHEVGDLRRERSVAHGHDERADARDAVPHREDLRPVLHHHRHAVARGDAGVGQRVGDAVGVGVELAEGDASVTGDECDALRIVPGDAVDASSFHGAKPNRVQDRRGSGSPRRCPGRRWRRLRRRRGRWRSCTWSPPRRRARRRAANRCRWSHRDG